MSQIESAKRMHPLIAVAAVAVILVSIVGVAAITGVLPVSNSKPSSGESLSSQNESADGRSGSGDSSSPTSSKSDAQYDKTRDAGYASDSRADNNERDAAPVRQAAPICNSCGTVSSVRAIEQQGSQGSGVGAVAGAVLGGVLGNQVGGGSGRSLATVAGAIGGGYAGNSIEKRTNTRTIYEISVRMENGTTRTFTPSGQPGWRAGDRVRVVDGNLVAQD